MELRHSLILSMVLHLCLFAAVLLLFSDLLGGNSKTQAVKVFLVELTEEVSSISEGRSDSTGALIQPLKVLKTKVLRFKRPSPIKAEKFSAVDIPDKTVSVGPMRKQSFLSHGVETDVTGGDIIDLNTHKETAEDPFLKNSSNEVIDVMSGSGTGINVYYSSFSHGSKGVMSAGIIEIIKNSIERAKTYPLLAKKRDIEGTVYISFRVSLRGELQELKILKSSGSSILDTATLDIVKKAAPFPYVDVPVEVPVVFRLN
ncbi:MAG: TonB family protein [Thermodesulfovibrionia bacterium]